MFITVEDAKIFATSFGPKGPVIVGLGGWIGSWELWVEPFSLLSETWRMISYDHRGTGATISPIESITFDRLVDDVFAVLDAFGVERCILAAESAGAAVALAAVLKNPQRFSGLVVVDGMYYRNTPMEKDPFFSGLKMDYDRTIDHFLQACAPQEDDEPVRWWGRKILNRASQESALALYQVMDSLDLRNELNQITLPTLILHGEADTILPVESAYQLVKLIPHAKLAIIKGASHVPTMTHPQEVAHEISNFFK